MQVHHPARSSDDPYDSRGGVATETLRGLRRPRSFRRAGTLVSGLLAFSLFPVQLVGQEQSSSSPAQEATTDSQARLEESADALASVDLDLDLPLDPEVIVGSTRSGVRYYLRRNGRPEGRAELRLVVRSGSLQEDDDQLGLAHFVEHMAFNGTEHFDKNEAIEYMRSIGMAFGAGVNAYTTYDRTVYRLQVPTEDEEAIERALLILEDWAAALSFEPEEIDRERGVVLEEWRGGRGAAARVRDQHVPELLAGSRRALRIPIGDPELLQTFPHEALIRYYRTWYRPERMAVIAIGDFELKDMRKRIEKAFRKLGTKGYRPSGPPPEEIVDRVELSAADRYSVATDPEVTRTRFERMVRHRAPRGSKIGDFRGDLVDSLFLTMFNERFGEIVQEPDPPFLGAGAGLQRVDRSTLLYALAVTVAEGKALEGLERLAREAERVRRHGFLTAELERQRTDLLRAFERRAEESENTSSSAFVGPLVDHFVEGDAYPSARQRLDLARRLLPTITLEEVNAAARRWSTGEDRVTLVTAPEDQSGGLPPKEEVLGVFDRMKKAEIEPWVDEVSEAPLLETLPEPGQITRREVLEPLGVHHWWLSNGVEVYLKPTDFKKDEVMLSAFSPGGTSLVSDDDFASASMASTILSLSGVGPHSLIELNKLLTGKVARVAPTLGEESEGFRGGGSPDDLETLFQVLYLQATAPRFDAAAFASFETRIKGLIENRRSSPEVVFSETIEEVMFQDHPRRQPLDEEFIAKIDHRQALETFRERFADFSDFTFLLVGSFDLEQVEPLIERYLASLPSTGRVERPKDLGIRVAEGRLEREVRMGLEEKAQVQILLTGQFEQSVEERLALQTMLDVLRARLRDRVREELGGTYGVALSASTSHWPVETYQVAVSFGADPQRIDELTEVVFAEMDRLAEGPIDAEEVAKVKETMRRNRETAMEQNGFWMGAMGYALENDEPLDDILSFEQRLAAVDQRVVQEAAKRYLERDNLAQFVLRPAEDQAPDESASSESSASGDADSPPPL